MLKRWLQGNMIWMFFQDCFIFNKPVIFYTAGCVIYKDVSVLEKPNGSRSLNLLITRYNIHLLLLYDESSFNEISPLKQ